MVRRGLSAAIAGGWVAIVAAPAVATNCDDLLPPVQVAEPARDVTALDLVRLRDIGNPHAAPADAASPFAVSPDGRSIAFLLQRAEPRTNQTCLALVVAAVGGRALPRILDRGGVPITLVIPVRGLMVDSGVLETVTPAWSPDGRWIAWRKRDGAATRAWVVAAAGGPARPVAATAGDVEAFTWAADSRALVLRVVTGEAEQRAALAREAAAGYRYDERFVPAYGSQPRLRGPLATVARVAGLDDRAPRPATHAEIGLLDPRPPKGAILESRITAKTAWTTAISPSPLAQEQLWVRRKDGAPRACAASACRGTFVNLWWEGSGRHLLFLKREGWTREESVLYRWDGTAASPRQLLRTRDVLNGCAMAGAQLLCIHQGATVPRRIVSVDPASGRIAGLFDPNPEFARLRLGQVRRLHWRNALGLEAWGDLVLPPGKDARSKLPLILVQYHSDGFLRGGTGDEYPIHALAARGMAVLSFERPVAAGTLTPGLSDYAQVNAANARDWAERRSLLSALLTGVERAVATGRIDPKRIGITGMSDGATTVAFALASGYEFAAASISSCCMDPNTVNLYGGPAWAAQLRADGFPPATAGADAFWRPASLARAAARTNTPLLMQLADEEYLLGLEAYGALQDFGRPVEMFVFPDEHHTKRQPAHRLAIYVRNLDWFDFWLRGIEDPDPAKRDQYARWRSMRRAAAFQVARPGLGIVEPHQPRHAVADTSGR